MEPLNRLRSILIGRAGELNPEIKRRLSCSDQVVIFGSYAVGEESELSDIDVFCLGDCRLHYKDTKIEIFILPEYDAYSEIWLGSELACHISHYGVPLNDRPAWFDLTYVSGEAKSRKENRIHAYLRALDKYWDYLGPKKQARFSTKIRREVQRFSFINDSLPVPPTRILDRSFESWKTSHMNTLCERLHLDPKLIDRLSTFE